MSEVLGSPWTTATRDPVSKKTLLYESEAGMLL
jgi:hypothetical protein